MQAIVETSTVSYRRLNVAKAYASTPRRTYHRRPRYCPTRVQGYVVKKTQRSNKSVLTTTDLDKTGSLYHCELRPGRGGRHRLCTMQQLGKKQRCTTSYQGVTNRSLTCPVACSYMVVLEEEFVETPVDYGAALINKLYTTMEETASGTRRVEYLEYRFADRRGNSVSLGGSGRFERYQCGVRTLEGYECALNNHLKQKQFLSQSRPKIEKLCKTF